MRTFIALELNDTTKSALEIFINSLKPRLGKISWVKAENIHLTMKFLGEISEDRITDIQEELSDSATSTKPIQINISSLGCFPDSRKARVLWAGMQGDIAQLQILKRTLESGLQRIGLEKDSKKFSPHITLARIKKPIDSRALNMVLEENKARSFGSEVFDHISLIKSDLTAVGAIYTRLFKAQFLG